MALLRHVPLPADRADQRGVLPGHLPADGRRHPDDGRRLPRLCRRLPRESLHARNGQSGGTGERGRGNGPVGNGDMDRIGKRVARNGQSMGGKRGYGSDREKGLGSCMPPNHRLTFLSRRLVFFSRKSASCQPGRT